MGLTTLSSMTAFAAELDGRIYACTSRIAVSRHLESYWGVDKSSLKEAQDSALAVCRRDSQFNSFCKVDGCWSKLVDGSDLRTEATK
jgi:hypothetical protein